MSKDPASKDPDLKEGDEAARLRRRRKGGLRVPEDNVPRPTAASGDGLAVAPVYAGAAPSDTTPYFDERRPDDDAVAQRDALRGFGDDSGPVDRDDEAGGEVAALGELAGTAATSNDVTDPPPVSDVYTTGELPLFVAEETIDESAGAPAAHGAPEDADAVPRRVPRHSTVALSDADIEEFDDSDPSYALVRAEMRARMGRANRDTESDIDATAPMKRVSRPSLPPGELDEAWSDDDEAAVSTVDHDERLLPSRPGDEDDEGEDVDLRSEEREALEDGEPSADVAPPRRSITPVPVTTIVASPPPVATAPPVAVPASVVAAPPAVAAPPPSVATAPAVELAVEEGRARRPSTEPPPPPAKAPGAAPVTSAAGKPKPPPAPAPTTARAAAAVAAATDLREGRRPRRRGKPWFEEIFDEDYLRTLPFLTPQATQLEANFVMDSLAIGPGSQVLDIGCGYGRHAMELAARGYHVVGLDSSLSLLLRGADEAQRRGLSINFVHGDMREINFDAQFDGAYCLFSTFGFFDDETNKRTAQNIARALKPGARCVIEVLNRDYVITDLPSRVWWEGDGCVVLEEVDFNYFSSRVVSNRSVVFDDGRQLEQEISLRSFSLHELGKLLHTAGFRVVEVSGSMLTRGRFFGACSRDIVVVAERRVDKSDAAR